jgi:membrane protein YdbS with pleckstrin-like domain
VALTEIPERPADSSPPDDPTAEPADRTGAAHAPADAGRTPEDTDRPRPVLPPVADGRFKSLDPRSVLVSRIGGAIGIAIVGLVNLIGISVVALADGPPVVLKTSLFAGWFVLLLLLGAAVFFWPAARYRHASYRVNANGIQIRRGVFWRAEISVPRSRVQHTDVTRGPIARGFGLATLVLHTAGTEHASVTLEGLSEEAALAIRDYLIEGGEDDAV